MELRSPVMESTDSRTARGTVLLSGKFDTGWWLRMAPNSVVLNEEKTTSIDGQAVWFGEPRSRWRTVLWVMFTLGICLHFTLAYNLELDFLDLKAYMLGVEKTPYQYRILMMYVFQLLATKHIVVSLAQHTQHMHVPAEWQKPQKLVQIGVAMVSLFGAVLATAGTLTKLTGDRIFSRWMSLLLIYMTYAN